MKFSAALITSCMAAGVLAQTPMIFYAKFNDSMKPLFGDFVNPPAVVGANFSILSYNESHERPAEFILEEDYAVTYDEQLTPGYVGFFHNLLSYGGLITKTKLRLDEKMRVTNGDFYSCDGYPRGVLRWVAQTPTSHKEECFKVEVYFMPKLGE